MKDASKQIDPIKLADQKAKIEDTLPIHHMTRLRELLTRDDGHVTFSLAFTKDSDGQRVMIGVIQAELHFPCQRCGDTVKIELNLQTRLWLLLSESQATQCPETYEPLVTHGETVSLLEMIEHELLLNMPMCAHHRECQCSKELPDFLH